MNKSKNSEKILLGERPHYYGGQLLLEGDFRDEQRYHIEALCHHNLRLHDWGVAAGLTVSCHKETIQIAPGFAIDSNGRELVVDTPKSMSVSEFGPDVELTVSIAYKEVPDTGEELDAAQSRRIQCYAVLSVQRREMPHPEVLLAIVRLDDEGRASLDQNDNPYRETRYARVLAPGSIKASHLHDSLRRGWLRLPFRPDPLPDAPRGLDTPPPPFSIGETEAASSKRGHPVGGVMAIPLSPGITKVTRLRLAGKYNEGEIGVRLVRGGWDAVQNSHLDDELLNETIKGDPKRTYNTTFSLDEHTFIDPQYHTLALVIWGTQRTSISLVAIEIEYN